MCAIKTDELDLSSSINTKMERPKSSNLSAGMNNHVLDIRSRSSSQRYNDISSVQSVPTIDGTTLDYDEDPTNFKHRTVVSEPPKAYNLGQYSPLARSSNSCRSDLEAPNYLAQLHIADTDSNLSTSGDPQSPHELLELALRGTCLQLCNTKYNQHTHLSSALASPLCNFKHKMNNPVHIIDLHNPNTAGLHFGSMGLNIRSTTTPRLTSVFSITSSVILLLALLQPPIAMATNIASREFHPSQVLSLPSEDQTSRTNRISAHRTSSGDQVQEDEILHHLYRNGRNMADFRKPSVTFMVELFNDLQSGGTLGYSNRVEPVTDTVRSFSGANSRKSRKGRRTVDFYVPFLPQHETLRAAEIRFLRSPSQKKAFRRFRFRMDVRAQGRVVNKFTFRENAKPQFEYNVFDVTSIVRPWINNHHGNMSLHIRVSRKLRNHLLMPSKGNASQSTSLIVLYLEDKEFLKNMYASFTKGDENLTVSQSKPSSTSVSSEKLSKSRRKRSVESPVSSSENKSLTVQLTHNQNPLTRIARRTRSRRLRNRKSKSRRYGKNKNCKMYDFHVDFTVIGWGEWIIHPKRFNSKFCFGSCPSPIEAKYHPTNHAMLQTLMRMKLPNVAPAPCCVPTKLKAVSMLYVEFDEIVVRSHEDMIVDQCGCR